MNESGWLTMRDYMFCFTFNMHMHGMYINSLRAWCSEVALSGSLRLIRRRGVSAGEYYKDTRGKGRPVVKGECQRTRGHKKKGEWRTAENTLTLACDSVHNATSSSVVVASIGPTKGSSDKPGKQGTRKHRERYALPKTGEDW